MPTRVSPKDFLSRAREKGAEINKDIINGEEVRRELQPSTRKNCTCAVALWDQYQKEHPDASPNDIEASKKFVMNIAYRIEGKYDNPIAALGSVVGTYKNFTAGWQWKGNKKIDNRVTLSTSNFIKTALQDRLKLAHRKRERRYGTMVHFIYLGTQLWQNDWHTYRKPGFRIDLWAEIQLNIFTSARVGEYIESTCRGGSGRGLRYRDITFGVFKNEQGEPEFAIQVVKDAKGMTRRPNKRPQHSLHEDLLQPRPLFCNPMLTHLTIFIRKSVFRDYKTIDEILDLKPLENEMFPLEWDDRVLDLPLYQKDNGNIESAGVHSDRLQGLGLRAGYACPPITHDLRAEGLYLINQLYSQAQRKQHTRHHGDGTYEDHYAPQNPGTDGQGSYFGDAPCKIVSDLFRAMTLSRNPELWQSLPAEKQNELENSPEYIAIESDLASFRPNGDDPKTRDRQKELLSQKRKLVSEQLRKIQKLQPRKLFSNGDEADIRDHHRTQFQRICALMPERDRLASSLFTVVPIRSDEGRAVLRDMIGLYRQDTEVAFRPGLEPDKCHCPEEWSPKIKSKPASQRWRHIYSCHKKRLSVVHGFAKLCFLCSEWFTSKGEWIRHCQIHLDKPEMLPIQCNPLIYGGCLASPRYCPFCLGDPALLATLRMHQYLDRDTWRDHINQHVETLEMLKCPHPRSQCLEEFPTIQHLKFHLQDIHCIEPRKDLKRSAPIVNKAKRPRLQEILYSDISDQKPNQGQARPLSELHDFNFVNYSPTSLEHKCRVINKSTAKKVAILTERSGPTMTNDNTSGKASSVICIDSKCSPVVDGPRNEYSVAKSALGSEIGDVVSSGLDLSTQLLEPMSENLAPYSTIDTAPPTASRDFINVKSKCRISLHTGYGYGKGMFATGRPHSSYETSHCTLHRPT